MNKFCIVIPIYKEELTCIEQISLKRLYDIIGDKGYDVYVVGPEMLNICNYKQLFPTLKFVEFDNKYFQSILTYSQLCRLYDFYNTFNYYDYMLLYQLDCYLLKDDILEWCNKNYDYIGSPIMSFDCGWKTWPAVGNGGLSLRKISTFCQLTDPNGKFIQYLYKNNINVDEKYQMYEDLYFCEFVKTLYNFNIPTWQDAARFSIDMNPDLIIEHFHITNQMGLHAIDKNIRFYKKYIIDEFKDNKEVIDYCESKYEKFFNLYYLDHDQDKYNTIQGK